MFSNVRIEDRLESRLKELQQSNITYTKKQVVEHLGVTSSQLDILTRKYRLQPFWRRSSEDGEVPHKLSLVLNDDEYQAFKAALQKSGYRFDRHFAKHCLMKYIAKGDGSN